MKLVIEVNLDNAAFDDDQNIHELRRIMDDLLERLPDPLDLTDGPLNLHDVNGNHCGEARIVDVIQGKPIKP